MSRRRCRSLAVQTERLARNGRTWSLRHLRDRRHRSGTAGLPCSPKQLVQEPHFHLVLPWMSRSTRKTVSAGPSSLSPGPEPSIRGAIAMNAET